MANFIKLTTFKDGVKVLVNPDKIVSIEEIGDHSQIMFYKTYEYHHSLSVKENIDAIEYKLNKIK